MATSFLSRVWNFLKSLPGVAWEVLSFVVLVLVALFYRGKSKEANSQLEVANAEKTDAVLATKQEALDQQDKKAVEDGETKKSEIVNQTPEELAKKLNGI